MRWIITKDHHAEGHRSTVGIGNINRHLRPKMKAVQRADQDQCLAVALEIARELKMDYEFRLKDDDGSLDCEGQCLQLDQMDGDEAFEPLDWAEHMYGSTTMEIRKVGETKWEQL